MAQPSILLARLTLADAFGNRSALFVRRGENRELILMLDRGALSNLQGKTLPPAFCREGDAETVTVVHAWVREQTLAGVTAVERGPSAELPKAPQPVKARSLNKARG